MKLTYKHLVGKNVLCLRANGTGHELAQGSTYTVSVVLGDTISLMGVGGRDTCFWSVSRFAMSNAAPIIPDQHLVGQDAHGVRIDAVEDRLDKLFAEQAKRITELETRLENHITVPSWWNKKVDKRLDALEKDATVMIEVPRVAAENWSRIKNPPAGLQFLVTGSKEALKE